MLYAGLDLSRKRLDFHLLDGEGATVEVGAAPPDADGLLGLTRRLDRHREPIRAAIESMNGARFVHDRLELQGWQVEIADAQKVKGLAPLACKIGDIVRCPSPRKLAGYTGLCPRVYQSGERDLRGPLAKQGPKYLRWALVEAATHACTAPVYRDRYQHTKTRIGKQRGAKVAQIDLARRLSEAIWHMLSRNQPFAPKGATDPLAASRSLRSCATGPTSNHPTP